MPVVYWTLLILLLLTGCDNGQALSEKPLILTETASWQLSLSNADAPVETPLQLTLTTVLSDNKVPAAIEADIVGISMYMGKIPLRFTAATGTDDTERLYTAEFLLGACSEPNMQWQLNINIRYNDGTVDTLSSKFTSSWH